jgi:hypothetical protein
MTPLPCLCASMTNRVISSMWVTFFQGIVPRSVTHHSGLSVTYLAGSNPRNHVSPVTDHIEFGGGLGDIASFNMDKDAESAQVSPPTLGQLGNAVSQKAGGGGGLYYGKGKTYGITLTIPVPSGEQLSSIYIAGPVP